ncbi:hypothetical protein V493_08032 [Pseudogymnoascus sp. VKM F-4281 (FW-2241)]|nr:hypothetical protein V493_08032 [Pseudogymnoascus sp. VKM F-4281 (FW-2241)]
MSGFGAGKSGMLHPVTDVEFVPDMPDVLPASPVIECYDANGEPESGNSFIHRRELALKSKENVIMWERSTRQLAPIE